ncbi:major facilitator superfamily transporter [Colletotrichum paranaense]|uniref:Major facilitator superfamily transporter n=1 Tax=Colletotrichum paranaense TaxID=1914294 RepID=A0ABQ9T6D6_9PEZI|nr:major facilitator superfamily transporter [Colletotrichum paranaense]KAK1546711.1 major facilitator superfamily transporter [Colletotrichum paranaense]
MTVRDTDTTTEKSGSGPDLHSTTPSETTLTPADPADPEPQANLAAGAEPLTTSTPGPVPDGGLEAWIQVLGSWVILADTWGLVNTFGVYQTYYERTLPGVTPSAISWIGSLQGALLMMVGPISGPLYDAGYFRELVWAGITLIILGMFMTSLCTTYWQVLLAQGVCVGLGCGLVFLPSTAILSQYFHRRRALVIGLAATGSPIAGMCFPILFGHLEPRIGFGWATRIMAFILLGLSVIPAVSMHTRLPPSGHKRSLVDRTALRDPAFMLVMAGSFVGFLAMYVPYFYIQLFAVSHDIGPANFSSYFVTLLSAGSIPGRVIPNYLADKVGALYMQISVAAGSAVLMFAWLGIRNMAGLVVFAILYGLFSGGMVSISPTVIVSLSPDLGRVGTRMGMINFVAGIAILIGTPIAGAILGDYSGVAWQSMIGYGAAALTVGSMVLTAAKIFQLKGERRDLKA